MVICRYSQSFHWDCTAPALYSASTVQYSTARVIDQECTNPIHENREELFGQHCKDCGEVITYADDSTYHTASKKRTENQRKIDKNILKLQTYMNNNELFLNMGKTTVLELMIKQKKGRTQGNPPMITVRTGPNTVKEITDKGTCKILGAKIQANINWTEHLEKSKGALFPSLRQTLGALQHQGRRIPRKVRKLLVAGLIQSRLTYLLPIWGATQNNTMRKAQTILNKAGRWTTGLPRSTRTEDLMKANDWLSIREMTNYHSLVLMWKTVHRKRPKTMHKILQLDMDNKIQNPKPRLQFSSRTYRHRTSVEWNTLPEDIRNKPTLGSYKRTLKTWIKERRQQTPD